MLYLVKIKSTICEILVVSQLIYFSLGESNFLDLVAFLPFQSTNLLFNYLNNLLYLYYLNYPYYPNYPNHLNGPNYNNFLNYPYYSKYPI
jgi:hypothetical protein